VLFEQQIVQLYDLLPEIK